MLTAIVVASLLAGCGRSSQPAAFASPSESPTPSSSPSPTCSGAPTFGANWQEFTSAGGNYCFWYPADWYHTYSGAADPQLQLVSNEDFANESSERLDTGVVLVIEVGDKFGARCTGLYVKKAVTIYRSDQISFVGSTTTRYVLQAGGSSILFMSLVEVLNGSTCYQARFMSYSLDTLNTTLPTDDQILSTFTLLS